jgi:hypothetical protein
MGIYVQQTQENFTLDLKQAVFFTFQGSLNINASGILNNKLATLSIPDFQQVSGINPGAINFQLPGDFAPSHPINKLIEVIDNNVHLVGSINIDTSGLCIITVFPNTFFNANGLCGFNSIDITYPVK